MRILWVWLLHLESFGREDVDCHDMTVSICCNGGNEVLNRFCCICGDVSTAIDYISDYWISTSSPCMQVRWFMQYWSVKSQGSQFMPTISNKFHWTVLKVDFNFQNFHCKWFPTSVLTCKSIGISVGRYLRKVVQNLPTRFFFSRCCQVVRQSSWHLWPSGVYCWDWVRDPEKVDALLTHGHSQFFSVLL